MLSSASVTQVSSQPKSISSLLGPPGLPLLGNVLQIDTTKFHRIIERWSRQYGQVFKIYLATTPVVVVTDPLVIQYVLKNRPEKFRRMSKMDEIIREVGVHGVFNAEGEDWKIQRKLVSQALNIGHIKSFYPLLDETSHKFLNRLKRLADDNKAVHIKAEFMRYTVDITTRLAFGYSMNTIEKNGDVIQDHLEIMFPAIFDRINAPIPYWRYIKLPADRKLERSIAAIRLALQSIIEETKVEMEKDQSLFQHPKNFLQALLAAATTDSPVSDEVVFGNVVTMLLAGEDTTAHTLTWIIYFMHLYPDIQQRMQEEADRICNAEDTLTCYDDTLKLPYIEAVAMEAMRLKPVAPVLFHNALEDCVLAGVNIPKGTGIFLQTQYSGIDESHFSNAEKFIPDRWLIGGCPAHAAHNDKAFFPFGAGPRFCPGYLLAMTEIKAVLALICRHFTVSIAGHPDTVKEKLAFTMMPSDFSVHLTRRRKD